MYVSKICPRCDIHFIEPNLHSLFYPILICRGCAVDEAKNKKRIWKVHPDIAQYEQETGQKFKGVIRSKNNIKLLNYDYFTDPEERKKGGGKSVS